MSEFDRTAGGPVRPGAFAYDSRSAPELFDGVLSKRIVAFIVDAIIIVALMIPAVLVLTVVGFVTLGLAWLLFPALFAIVALGYVALTLGGRNSATVGMRWAGSRHAPGTARRCSRFWRSCTPCSSGSQ